MRRRMTRRRMWCRISLTLLRGQQSKAPLQTCVILFGRSITCCKFGRSWVNWHWHQKSPSIIHSTYSHHCKHGKFPFTSRHRWSCIIPCYTSFSPLFSPRLCISQNHLKPLWSRWYCHLLSPAITGRQMPRRVVPPQAPFGTADQLSTESRSKRNPTSKSEATEWSGHHAMGINTYLCIYIYRIYI